MHAFIILIHLSLHPPLHRSTTKIFPKPLSSPFPTIHSLKATNLEEEEVEVGSEELGAALSTPQLEV
jgi:hypothetical protein